MRRLLAAVLVCAACAPASVPPGRVVVQPVDGTALPMGRLIGDDVAARLRAAGIDAVTGAPEPGDWTVQGYAVAAPGGPAATARYRLHWTLLDADGASAGRHTHAVAGSPWHWEYGDPRLIRAVAEAAAPPLARLLVAKGVQPSPPPAPAGVFVRPPGGVAYARAAAFAEAMRAALAARGLAVAADAEAAAYVVEGGVALEPPIGTRQRLRIAWTVRSAAGDDLGTIDQSRAFPLAELDGPWGPLADTAARSASEAIANLVRRDPRRRPSLEAGAADALVGLPPR